MKIRHDFQRNPLVQIAPTMIIVKKLLTPLLLVLTLLASCSKEDGEKQQYTLTVETSPSEGGTVSPASGSFDSGETVSLSATPASDHVFKNWSGAVSGSDNSITLTMDGDKTVTAVFEKRQYPLTIDVEGEGTVRESLLASKTTDYASGSSVQLTPEPAEGWEFVEWTGDASGTESPLTISVDGETNITAVFRPLLEGLIIGKWDVENNNTGTTGKGDGTTAMADDNDCTVFSLVFNLDGTFVLNLSSGQFEGSFAFESADSITLESTGTITNISITSGTLTFNLSLPQLCELQVTAEPDPDYEAGECVSFLDCNEGKVWKRQTGEGMEYIRLLDHVEGIWIERHVLDLERECLLSTSTNQTGSTFLLGNDIDELVYVLDDTEAGDIEVTLTLTEDGSLSMAQSGLEGADYYGAATAEELDTYLQTYEACPLPLIYLAENGVTIKARDDAQVGDTGEVNGITYTVVDEATLRQMVANGEDVTKVCTTKVTDMSRLFEGEDGAVNEFNQDIGGWDTSNVTDMSYMFSISQFNHDIGGWNVSNVIDMGYMFFRSSFNQDIGDWDVGSVIDMNFMFYGSPFNLDIGNWDVSNVTFMNAMFERSEFNQDIGNWDVSSVTGMVGMFNDSPFNQDIGGWDVSSVTGMIFMFSDATSFNQDLSGWDIGSVTGLTNCSDFSFNTPQWTLPKPNFPFCNGYLITDLLSEIENLQNLVAALSAANGNLPTVLRGDGPFTVLAPTDEAFENFLNGASLGDIPVDVLTNVLLNHVISGEVTLTDLTGLGSGYTSTMATGAGDQMVSLFFDTSDGVTFNGVSSVTTADLKAINGIVHIVDAVIDIPNIVDHAVANPGLSGFLRAWTDFGNTTFTDLLFDEEETLTVFAPGNDAFSTFTNPNSNDLNAILSNHVVVGAAAFSSDLTNSYVNTAAEFVTDENLSLYINTDDGVSLNGISNVVTADIVASNGVIHTVDAILDLPTVMTFAVADPIFDSLQAALTAEGQPDFVNTLSGAGPFTVFAPTNDAFQTLLDSNDMWNGLADIDGGLLTSVLEHHVVPGANVRSGDLSDGATATTLEGDDITINLPGTGDNIADITDGAGNPGIGIDAVDVQAINGVIHTLDTVIIPKQ
jgi:surface protein